MRRIVCAAAMLAASVAALLVTTSARAQADYPARTISIVVPFPPGGTGDIAARLVGEKMSPRLGQPVIIENKPGAVAGPQYVISRPVDGYTMLSVGATGFSTVFMKNPPFDFLKELTPISQYFGGGFFFIVHSDLPVRNLKELVEYAKARPGKLNSGAGSTQSALAMTMFKRQMGLDIVEIPYKGAAPTSTALLSGEVQVLLETLAANRPMVDAGKFRVLAVTGDARTPATPDVPTIIEAGLPPLKAGFRTGLWVRAGTSPAIVEKLNRAVVEVMKLPEVREPIIKAGLIPVSTTPEAYRQGAVDEIEFWREAAKLANFQPE